MSFPQDPVQKWLVVAALDQPSLYDIIAPLFEG